MVVNVQKRINTNNTATVSSAIALNATTTTTVAVANVNRIFFRLSNASNQSIFLKLQAASVDNDLKGIFIDKGE